MARSVVQLADPAIGNIHPVSTRAASARNSEGQYEYHGGPKTRSMIFSALSSPGAGLLASCWQAGKLGVYVGRFDKDHGTVYPV
jgi:hypothetical protein